MARKKTKEQIELEEFLQNWRNRAFTTPNGAMIQLMSLMWIHRDIIAKAQAEVIFLGKLSDAKKLSKMRKGITTLAKELRRFSDELLDLLIEDAEIVEE